MSAAAKRVSVIIPFFNEEANIDLVLSTLERELPADYAWELVAVNDGSSDRTLQRLIDYPLSFDKKIVDLSRNFGKEAALSAGLAQSTGAAVIPMDADLQDPPQLVRQMLVQWEAGFEVVTARRIDRSSDSAFKRATAHGFYRLINYLSDVAIPENVGDFRLMDRCVVDALLRLGENRRFMKGLFAWIGFRSTSIDYVRPERARGTSKFNGWRLWNFALEGITSFSTVPLRVWSYLGFLTASLALCYGGIIMLKTLIFGISVPGYASLACLLLFLSGVQLVGMGILGEYLGRTYMEAKRRPPYVIRQVHAMQPDRTDNVATP